MTDDELADFLSIAKDDPLRAKVGKIAPAKRAAYEAMADKVMEMQLYNAELGPLPAGVLICRAKRRET